MNLICPHCQQTIAVPDTLAGQTSKCPQCGGPFTVPVPPRPAMTPPMPSTPAPDPLSPTVGMEAPPPPTSAPAERVEEPVSGVLASEYRPRFVVPLQRQSVHWTALVCFLLLFFLLLFPWIVSPLDGKFAFSQTGYGVAFGGYSPAQSEGKDRVGTAPFVILFFLVVLVGFLLGIGLLVVQYVLPRMGEPVPIPVKRLMPHRSLIVGALAILAFLFLGLQFLWGFPAQYHQFPTDSEVLRALLYKTIWLRLTLVIALVALLAALADFWLERRGKRPAPKLTIEW